MTLEVAGRGGEEAESDGSMILAWYLRPPVSKRRKQTASMILVKDHRRLEKAWKRLTANIKIKTGKATPGASHVTYVTSVRRSGGVMEVQPKTADFVSLGRFCHRSGPRNA